MAEPKETRTVEIIVNGQRANASLKEMNAAAAVLSNQVAKIAADDPKRAELIAQLQAMRQRIAETRAEVAGLVQTQEQLAAAQATVVAEQQQAIAAGKSSTASYNEMKVAAGLLEKQLHEMAASDPSRAALIADFQNLKARMGEARTEIDQVVKSEAQLRIEEEALLQAQAEQLAMQQRTIVAGKSSTASFVEMKVAAGLLEKQLHELSADDPGRAALIADYQALKTRMGAARQEMEVTAKTEAQLRAEQDALRASQVQLVVNGQKVSASMREMREAAQQLEKELDDLSQHDPARGPLLASLQQMKARIREAGEEVAGVTKTTNGMKSVMLNAFSFAVGGGIEQLVEKTVELGKDVFDTTAKFQTFESVMTNALGDKSKAQQAMKDIQDMAAKTPFSVEELTGSFIKFVNRGLNPSMLEMGRMADIAASQGKSFDQLTEAVLDAGTGEFERLKEFGISASKSGDQVSLSFKGVNQTVKATPEAINGAIIKFGEMKGIAGSTAAVSKTLEGQLSNLGDTAGQLEVKVGTGLKPVFTLILTLFGRFLDWIGRFIEAAGPLKALFAEVTAVFRDLYHDIADVLESLGLFSSKTDTVQLAVEALKLVLTLMLIPIKAVALAAKGIVDVFIDWYNKSELLRGILGGLGAVVVSLFTTIKDDAIKLLGGVGDILVGIFTLDKDKIVAGFKSALNATADAALKGGERAAAEFIKGYDANKNNRITRTVQVKTQEEGEGPRAGIDLKSDPSASDDAAAKKVAAAAKKAAAEALKARLAEIEAEKQHQEMLLKMRQAAMIARGDERVSELSAIYTDGQLKIVALRAAAQKELAEVNGTAKQKAARRLDIERMLAADIALVDAEWRAKQTAQLEKNAQEDAKLQKEYIDGQIEGIEEEAERKQAAFDVMFDAGLTSQQAADEAKYQARKAALEAELTLIAASLGTQSDEYRKAYAAQLKNEKDHDRQTVTERTKAEKAKRELAKMEMQTAGEVLSFGLDLLTQDEDARKKHHGLYVALAAAKIVIDGAKEVQAIWQYSAEQPENSLTAGVFGTVLAGVQTALAVGRTAVALSKIGAGGSSDGGGSYWAGGATGTGAGLAVSPMGQLMAMSGMSIGANGRLQDGSGFAVAGIVHEDEYVVPKWMRADPQVAAVEQWLEARRLRGFADGGATSASAAQLPVPAASPVTDGEKSYAVQTQMLATMQLVAQQLGDVKQWQRDLNVRLDLRATQSGLDEYDKVAQAGAIRSKS